MTDRTDRTNGMEMTGMTAGVERPDRTPGTDGTPGPGKPEPRKDTQRYIGVPNGVVLCINRAGDGELAGEFYHSYSEQPVPFHGTGQMTLRMEKLYDWLRFPYPGTNTRSFRNPEGQYEPGSLGQVEGTWKERKRIMADEALLSKHGDIGTFVVRVQHRQNSSWQGRITWMEEDRTVQFRSVWEMIKLIEGAIDTVSEAEDDEAELWFREKAGKAGEALGPDAGDALAEEAAD